MAVFYGIVGVLAACCAIQVGIRARQEEAHGTAELVLGTPVPRMRWLLEYWIVGMIVIVIVLAAAALAGIAGAGSASDPESLIPNVLEAAAAQLPACLVFLGLTLLVFAFLPRATIPVGWTAVGVAAILGTCGPDPAVPRVARRPLAVRPLAGAVGRGDRLVGRHLDARHRPGRRRGRGRGHATPGARERRMRD